jgi:hypothetical protein
MIAHRGTWPYTVRAQKGAQTMITIKGTVGSTGKYLVSGAPVATHAHSVLRIAFENNTSGTNLALCAGTNADFSAGTVGTQLSDSGGPGFQFLTVIDAANLDGKIIYVLRQVGSADSQFTIDIE